jgi:hypothetical protein
MNTLGSADPQNKRMPPFRRYIGKLGNPDDTAGNATNRLASHRRAGYCLTICPLSGNHYWIII